MIARECGRFWSDHGVLGSWHVNPMSSASRPGVGAGQPPVVLNGIALHKPPRRPFLDMLGAITHNVLAWETTPARRSGEFLRRAGTKGGYARAERLTVRERKRIARKAALACWRPKKEA